MSAKYRSSVFEDYQKKMAEKSLPSCFKEPTPAQLRDECIVVCEERYDKHDEETLRGFFGRRDNCTAYIQAIKNCDTNKFKPLLNYLKHKAGKTSLKNIELLAWLIDFKPRPYDRYNASIREPVNIGEEKEESEKEVQAFVNETDADQNRWIS